MNMKFSKQRVIIVGGSSGIGWSTAQAFIHTGASVVITGRSQDKIANAQQQFPDLITGYCLEGSDEASVAKFFTEVGEFDHLVIAAGGGTALGIFANLDSTELHRAVDQKFWVHINVVRHSSSYVKSTGSITFVTGIAASKGIRGMGATAAINGAIEALTRPLALELAPVRVNAVSAGLIETPYWERLPESERLAFFQQQAMQLPTKRIGHVEDIADAILFLAGNSFVTGIVLPVDGGARLV